MLPSHTLDTCDSRGMPARSRHLGVLARVSAAIVKEVRFRRALRDLNGIDDVMLHDLGLGRGELEDAVRHGRCGC